MKFRKSIFVPLLLAALLALSACSGWGNSSNSIFPGIDNGSIPDILEMTVGTVGDTYYSAGITDAPDYSSIFKATFKDTTKEDYTKLMKHYKSASTGTDENGALLFDWGRLQISSDSNSITIHAFIK